MASVRLSHDLRNRIQRAARAAYNKATVEPNMDTATIELIWRGIVEHPTHIALTNFVAEHAGSIEDLYERTIGQRSTDKLCIFDNIKGRTDIKLPTVRKSWITRGYNEHAIFLRHLHLTEEEKLNISDKLTKLNNDRETADENQKNYNKQISNLLESCNTLKQLLDTQPSMKEFVPEDLLHQMHRKVTRESQARERREIAKVDGDLINRVVLTSKLVA